MNSPFWRVTFVMGCAFVVLGVVQSGRGQVAECNVGGPDCNGNGISDICDILHGTNPDCNENFVPDECDLASGSSDDCNGNLMPDECELVGNDCDADGVPDECESDCNTNGTPDDCDIINGASEDCDGSGVLDECEPHNGTAALGFDGVDDLARVPHADAYNFDQDDSFTIEIWLGGVRDVAATGSNILEKRIGVTRYPFVLRVLQSGSVSFSSSRGDESVPDRVVSSHRVDDGAWHHIAAVRDGTVSLRLYIDGTLVGVLIGLSQDAIASSTSIVLGGQGGGSRNLRGKLDELRIWNEARTLEEIRSTMNIVLTGTEPGLVGLWRLDEGQGRAISDSSTGGNDGWFGFHAVVDPADPTWVGDHTIPTAVDCNGNGESDECDIRDGKSEDCNANGIPDDCEPGVDLDCDGDGVSDLCDPDTAMDCNQNGIPDSCDLWVGGSEDCNDNSIPDECELDSGGSALDFDGANDLVRVLRTPLLEPTDELTIEAWIRADSIGNTNNSRIVRIANSFGAGYILSWRQSGSSKLELRIDGASGGACRATDPTPVSSYFGQWIHVAGVYSATQNICKLYVDGDLKADEPAVGTLNYSGSDLFFGNHLESGEDFDGLIDEVRIWNVARTQPEIIGHKDAALVGSEPGLVGYWRFNEASGQTVFDSSSHGHDGWLGGAPNPDVRDPQWSANGAPIAEPDCNENGLLDECEEIDEPDADCNANGVPDYCEPGGDSDCDGDGVKDLCELFTGASLDCNEDGTPDDCQLVDNDCNQNSVPDDCELDGGGSALDFDGADDSVRIPRSSALEPKDEVTIEVWIRPDSAGESSARVVRNMQPGGTAGYIIMWQESGDGRLQAQFAGESGSAIVYDTGHHSAYFGKWTHVAATYSRVANRMRLLVNGVLRSEGAARGSLVYANRDLWIGNFDFLSNQGFDGSIDEVRLWSYERTEVEILANMHQRLGGNEPGLIAYWRFNEASGQTAFDSTGHGHDGTLGNSADASGDSRDPLWTTGGAPITGLDCNGNAVPDECDIADGFSGDCDGNGTPDECEFGGTTDCDGNGTTDRCDPGGTEDCNQNGLPDMCDLLDGTSDDCNGNAIPDDCELEGGGSSLDFDGADDWVRIPRTPLLEPTDELTIEVWIRADSIGSTNNSRIVRIANAFGAGYILSWRQSGSSKLELRIDSASGGACRATDPTPVSTYFGQWIHAAGVYSASQGICKLYVNGELKADEPAVGTLRYSGSDLFIGNHVESGEDFDGLIDEVRIWDVARTRTQIIAHKDSALFGTELGLVGYWRFNEASAQTAFDSTPHGHDGTLGSNADPAGDGRDPLWASEGAPIGERDCNDNGILDECDIADLTSDDCNSNGVPDECEPDDDCNTNGVQDICDLADGTSDDCNATGVPDDCELVDNDCDGNGVPDECEDCNGNGLGDACDITGGTSEDCDLNGTPDECEPDCNSNDVADACDIRDGTSFDFDLDGVPDECKPDCNGNGFPDFLDIAFGISFDCDDDGMPDECEPDSDGDSIPNDCDALGDWDHDADIDHDDYSVFSICLDLSGPGGPPPFLDCLDRFDFNGDGLVSLADYALFSVVFGR